MGKKTNKYIGQLPQGWGKYRPPRGKVITSVVTDNDSEAGSCQSKRGGGWELMVPNYPSHLGNRLQLSSVVISLNYDSEVIGMIRSLTEFGDPVWNRFVGLLHVWCWRLSLHYNT
ncbi:hypothetical protein CEXT_330241 [Caerostris extrusa]|uniref:Uncharacterized protein n=1 Tax=Caerostris extrusa TaxID=172846 RepID=A0AAV4SJA7_CAEEX|nr:hypothetical protein CEXT_330241 [Caerostris extrusa]